MTSIHTRPDDPTFGATITVRVIKSFEFRTVKNIVFHEIDLDSTVQELKELVMKQLMENPGFKPYRSVVYDTIKIYTKAHGTKSQNLIINTDHDELILDFSKTLKEVGIENETELSIFNGADYKKFQAHPETKW